MPVHDCTARFHPVSLFHSEHYILIVGLTIKKTQQITVLRSLLVLCRMHNSEIRFIVIFYRSIERDTFNNDSTYIGIPIYIL